VGSPFFGVLYEPHNLIHHAKTDYRVALEIMKKHIVHCHFKDGAPTPSGEYGFTMMGDGDIDFPWIMEQLEAVGYEGDIALEYEVEEVAAGPSVAPFRKDRAHLKVQPNNLIAFEFTIHSWILEWGKRLMINLEDNALVTERGVEALYPMNEKIILIR